jgi:chorismate mutase/prephenate dehydratase
MSELDIARKEINEADKEIAAQFERRMRAVKTVAEYKKQRGLPVLDEVREAEVIKKNSALIKDRELTGYYIDFISHTMKISRDYQTALISGISVAYSGVEGAFASIAAKKLFPYGNRIPCRDFTEAYEAVVRGDCECAVIPIENSFAGEVGAVIDLIFTGPLYINDVFDLTVRQNLIGVPGATEQTVKTVVSHPQALSQCAEFIEKRSYKTMEYSNTARAAEYVAKQNDVSMAAIGTVEAAELYGLNVISRSINTGVDNTTRFAVFSRKQSEKSKSDNSFILVFSVKNQAGSLAEAIKIIGGHGYNMSSLHSRPMRNLPWQYYFYVECEGNANTEEGEKMMAELSEVCDRLKLAGSYKEGKMSV